MNSKPTTASILIMASGAVMLVASFLAWFGEGDFSVNGWDEFPLFTYGPLFGAICAGLVAARTFGNANLPANIAGFTFDQILKALAIFSFLVLLGIFLAGEDAKIGLILSLLASIALIVGTFMLDKEGTTTAQPGGAAPF